MLNKWQSEPLTNTNPSGTRYYFIMTLFNQRNIEAVYQLATLTEQQDGITWYPKAYQIAQELFARYDVTVAQVIGVIAALSPRNRWERNIQDADAIISGYTSGGADQASKIKVCTFTSNKNKAIKILELADGFQGMTEVLDILSGPKMQEFASCIAGESDALCIDGHAYCIWAGERTGLADVPSIGVKMRKAIKADYVKAAKKLGLTSSALQAITWVTWRRLHGV